MNRDNEALNLIMSELADELNISETMEKKAVSGYENVGSWLDSDDFDTRTVVYPQGSFALGTVIKPLSGDDEKHEYESTLYATCLKWRTTQQRRLRDPLANACKSIKGTPTNWTMRESAVGPCIMRDFIWTYFLLRQHRKAKVVPIRKMLFALRKKVPKAHIPSVPAIQRDIRNGLRAEWVAH